MISDEEFRELAMLARLDPDDNSLKDLKNDFNKILDFVQNIQEVQESASEDFRAPNETVNVIRADDPDPALGLDVISNFAPDWEAGHFVVPGVLDQEH